MVKMIVERVPDFISSPNEFEHTFAFDKNGRFIYVQKYLGEQNPAFLIYDVLFNEYIQLSADHSILNLKHTHTFTSFIWSFLPIDTKQMLLVVGADRASTLLVLIHLNLQQKTYGVMDQFLIGNCREVSLLRDDNNFGLFFAHNMVKEWGTQVDNEHVKFAFLPFEIQAGQIKIDVTKRKMFDYKPYNQHCTPGDLHLRGNKLWFIRLNDHDIQWAYHPRYKPPPNPDAKPCNAFQISYFDLDKEQPTETQVETITAESRYAMPFPMIFNLQWVQDSLLIQLTNTQFGQFDLLHCEWLEPLEIGFCFDDSLPDDKKDKVWAVFDKFRTANNGLVDHFQLFVDNQFILTCVDAKSGNLHRIPLRSPAKLTDMAWTQALNRGFLDRLLKSIEKLPYARAF